MYLSEVGFDPTPTNSDYDLNVASSFIVRRLTG